MPNCKMDFSDLYAKLGLNGSIRKRINEVGIPNALKEIAPDLEEMFKLYQDEYVYSLVSPKVYQRTFKFLNSVTSELNGNKLLIFADPDELPSNASTLPYSYWIMHGYQHW